MNGTQDIAMVKVLMAQAWHNVESLYAVAKIQHYNVGGGMGPDRHPPWRFLDPTALLAFSNRNEPWTVTASWRDPETWHYRKTSPAGTQVEYAGRGDHWVYSVDGVARAQGSSATRWGDRPLPRFDVGTPAFSPLENRARCWWLNPPLWVESTQFQLLETGSIGGRRLHHVIAYPDSDALRDNRGLWDMERMEDETIYEGHVYQLWVDCNTGFFWRLAAEADNGRAWDIMMDTLEINQPPEDSPQP